MSAIVCLKDKEVLVLGTDSRFMKHDCGGIASDSETKIHEVAQGTFIAASGWRFACDFERAKARELANNLNTTDIRKIAEALRREFTAYLQELVKTSYSIEGLHTYGGSGVCGSAPIHASILAGRDAGGELGWTVCEYSLHNGEIVNESGECSEGDERQIYARPWKPVQNIAQDQRTWTDSPVSVVRRFLADLKAANPRIGGPDQIVKLDCNGGHWIHLTAPEVPIPSAQLDHASVNVGSGGFTFTGPGGITISTGAGISVSPGTIYGAVVNAGTGGYKIFGSSVVNSNGAFVGTSVDVPGGCGASGFNPKSGGTQHFGASFTFRDLDGNSHQVVGGVIVS